MRRGSGRAKEPLSIRDGRDFLLVLDERARSWAVFFGVRDLAAAPATSIANLAWNDCSTCWASVSFKRFLSGSDRCAQRAASSLEARPLSSVTSLSRKAAEAEGSSLGSADRPAGRFSIGMVGTRP